MKRNVLNQLRNEVKQVLVAYDWINKNCVDMRSIDSMLDFLKKQDKEF